VRKEGTAVLAGRGHAYGGILCACCSDVFTASAFQAHAGRSYYKPFELIFTKARRSLKALVEERCPGEGGGAGGSGGAPRCGDAEYGCIVCHRHDFCKDGFGERTVIICDQCEREFHVGCAREAGVADLKARRARAWQRQRNAGGGSA